MDADFLFPSDRVSVMGVVNTTPDSFSDGGRFFESGSGELDIGRAVEAAEDLVRHGADSIDIGGESTRPGALEVAPRIQIERVVPVVAELAQRVDVPISVDTRSAQVADAALRAGASVVNDVSGLGHDHALAECVARADAALILGHMRGTPLTMRSQSSYRDLREEIATELMEAVERALKAGVVRERLVIDPGIGFSKDAEQSFALLGGAGWFGERFGLPVLVGPSRKSFLGSVVDAVASARDEATYAACAVAAFAGADAVRVHDVRGARQAVAVGRAAREATQRLDADGQAAER